MKKWSLSILALAALSAFFLTGWQSVGPGEVVVVRRLGRVLPEPWTSGAHWSWPLGVDRLSRVRLDEVRQLDFGRIDPAGPLDAPGSGEFLTGDRNIVRARGVVQYRVIAPVSFVLRAEAMSGILTRMTEAGFARSLSARPIDAPLRDGRAEVVSDVKRELTQRVSDLGLGIEILGVNLTDAKPPVEVEPAFAEAQSALSERDRKISEARALSGQLRPAAVATAESLTEVARTESHRKVELARAEADRFRKLLVEANRARSLTVQTLYRDALRDLLPKVRRKILLTPDEPVDLGVISR